MVECIVGTLPYFKFVDRLVGDLVEEVASPVPLQPRRVESVEEAVEHGVRHRRHELEGRRARLPNGCERLGVLVGIAGVAPHDPAHILHVDLLRERRPGRHHQEGEEAVEVFRSLREEVAVPAEHVGGLLDGRERDPHHHGVDGVEAERERGDHAEVAPAAAHRPEQVLVLGLARLDEAPVGEDDVDPQQIVDGEPALAAQVAVPTAESEPPDPGGRENPAGVASPKAWAA